MATLAVEHTSYVQLYESLNEGTQAWARKEWYYPRLGARSTPDPELEAKVAQFTPDQVVWMHNWVLDHLLTTPWLRAEWRHNLTDYCQLLAIDSGDEPPYPDYEMRYSERKCFLHPAALLRCGPELRNDHRFLEAVFEGVFIDRMVIVLWRMCAANGLTHHFLRPHSLQLCFPYTLTAPNTDTNDTLTSAFQGLQLNGQGHNQVNVNGQTRTQTQTQFQMTDDDFQELLGRTMWYYRTMLEEHTSQWPPAKMENDLRERYLHVYMALHVGHGVDVQHNDLGWTMFSGPNLYEENGDLPPANPMAVPNVLHTHGVLLDWVHRPDDEVGGCAIVARPDGQIMPFDVDGLLDIDHVPQGSFFFSTGCPWYTPWPRHDFRRAQFWPAKGSRYRFAAAGFGEW
ncbi:hypothetical protein A1O3_06108 [Capronia epimyces CBS 606.96]|uniref:Uncharacterized protein n=1 Tax=Capronia epimyces CBS 606.96 TaxID=1182542 RepID=W9XY30_9EURO|nr:uncharacterized protein A1O3_06108 [Capronia epimyces CBS 606.96]EXJ82295.1 hypothetical protein A1O3_06108 [Capronia epimyces CBS 606.96]